MAFLHQTLSRLGYCDVNRTLADVNNVLMAYRDLTPRDDTYFHQGHEYRWLALDGLLPTMFKGCSYQTPIVVWIPHNYPYRAPMAFVRPTGDMIIKHGHSTVDHSGQCFFHVLSNWTPANNLTEVVQGLQSIFSREPPLYTKPSPAHYNPYSSQPPPRHNPSYVPSASPFAPPPALSPYGSTSVAVTPPQNSIIPEPPARAAPKNPYVDDEEEDPMEQLTKHLRDRLKTRVRGLFEDSYSAVKDSVDKMEVEAKELQENIASAELHNAEVRREIGQLDDEKARLQREVEELQRWLTENEPKATQDEEAIRPRDALSCQILELKAEDATYDDMMYLLDKYLTEEKIAADAYV
eukprot:Sspe_Gene.11832::Locus_4017_Transcript_1_1_Confidence_1.000_Length_1128::g.11832::m.11832/K12183/TSG101, STP22, VPS23; ESCRT-I complex subunit TSG101